MLRAKAREARDEVRDAVVDHMMPSESVRREPI